MIDYSELIHETSSGRFIVAEEHNGQYQARMTAGAKRATGCHTVSGPSVDNVAASPNVAKYASRSAARRAAIRIYEGE